VTAFMRFSIATRMINAFTFSDHHYTYSPMETT
jgi:hypothetical protein